MNINSIAEKMKKAFERMKTPAEILPPTLLYCIAVKRPGVSATEAASKAISEYGKFGIATGMNPDGTPNVVNEYTYTIVKTVLDEIKKNGVVQVSIPANSIMVQATGGNAGGPVTCVGSNIISTTLRGILR